MSRVAILGGATVAESVIEEVRSKLRSTLGSSLEIDEIGVGLEGELGAALNLILVNENLFSGSDREELTQKVRALLELRKSGAAVVIPLLLDGTKLENLDLPTSLGGLANLPAYALGEWSSVEGALRRFIPLFANGISEHVGLNEIELLVDLVSGSRRRHEVGDELRAVLGRLEGSELIQVDRDVLDGASLGIRIADAAGLTSRGQELVSKICERLPLSWLNDGDEEQSILAALATDASRTFAAGERLVESVKMLERRGLVRRIAESDDVLAALTGEIAVTEFLEFTGLAKKLLGLGGVARRVKSPVPLEYPLRLLIHHEDRSLPLPLMPEINRKDWEFEVDLSAPTLAAAGLDNPYNPATGRDWVYFVAMFDPSSKKNKVLDRVNFYQQYVSKGQTKVRGETRGEAFSLFLSPLEDRSVWMLLNQGYGAFKEFADARQTRWLLEKMTKVLGHVKGATPLDLKTKVGKALLDRIGAKVDGKSPLEIAQLLNQVHGELEDGRIPEILTEPVKNVLLGLLSSAVLPHLNIVTSALKVFQFLDSLQNAHEFRLLELEAHVDGRGNTLLRVPRKDEGKLRLDANSDGTDGADLRHILAYHYRPLVTGDVRLGLVEDGQGGFSVALVETGEAAGGIDIEVTGDSYTFSPSVSLSALHLSAPLRLSNGSRTVCAVHVDDLGRVHVSGLAEYMDRPFRNVHFRAGYGFGEITSLSFDFRKR